MAAGSKFKSSRLKSVLISLVKSFLSLQNNTLQLVLVLHVYWSPVVARAAGTLVTSARGVGGGGEAGGVRGARTCDGVIIIIVIIIIIVTMFTSGGEVCAGPVQAGHCF